MLTNIHPKLPMRNKEVTRAFYTTQLGFQEFGAADFEGYLMMEYGSIQIHFFEYKDLNPLTNYGQVYLRTEAIDEWYQLLLDRKTEIHPNGALSDKPWGQKEFAILDPDHNLLTFGQSL